MSDPLEGAKLKIERANTHIEELTHLVAGYCSTQKYTTTFDLDPDGQRSLKAKIQAEPIPAMLSIIAGETLYQLRSALDHVMCALAIQNGATNITHTYFPTGADVQNFETQAKEKIKLLSPEARAMVASLEPFNGGKGYGLRLLNSINLVDKHQGLIAIASGVFSTSASFRMLPTLGVNVIEAPKFHDVTKDEIVIIRVPGGVTEMDGDLNISMDIALSEVDALKSQPILPTLKQFVDLVSGVTTIFEDKFFKS